MACMPNTQVSSIVHSMTDNTEIQMNATELIGNMTFFKVIANYPERKAMVRLGHTATCRSVVMVARLNVEYTAEDNSYVVLTLDSSSHAIDLKFF